MPCTADDGLGNLSLALKLEPQLPQLLREVIVMGGTIVEPGNVSPVAEANVWNAPHAADIVFTDPELFTLERGRIRVATEGLAQGQTIMQRKDFMDYPQAGWGRHLPLTDVCMQVDAAGCLDLFEQTLMSDWLKG